MDTPRPIRERKGLKLSVDFDGVIHDHENPIEGRKMGGVIKGAKEAIESLKKKRHHIIIFSARATPSGKQHIKDFLEYYKIPHDEITNVKTSSDYYIDDNGIRFNNWEDTLKQIK